MGSHPSPVSGLVDSPFSHHPFIRVLWVRITFLNFNVNSTSFFHFFKKFYISATAPLPSSPPAPSRHPSPPHPHGHLDGIRRLMGIKATKHIKLRQDQPPPSPHPHAASVWTRHLTTGSRLQRASSARFRNRPTGRGPTKGQDHPDAEDPGRSHTGSPAVLPEPLSSYKLKPAVWGPPYHNPEPSLLIQSVGMYSPLRWSVL